LIELDRLLLLLLNLIFSVKYLRIAQQNGK